MSACFLPSAILFGSLVQYFSRVVHTPMLCGSEGSCSSNPTSSVERFKLNTHILVLYLYLCMHAMGYILLLLLYTYTYDMQMTFLVPAFFASVNVYFWIVVPNEMIEPFLSQLARPRKKYCTTQTICTVCTSTSIFFLSSLSMHGSFASFSRQSISSSWKQLELHKSHHRSLVMLG